MNLPTNPLAENLRTLRKLRQYSQETVAEKIGVTRQAVAKWETGESQPDLVNANALAALYGVSLDDLVHHDRRTQQVPVPPRGKHVFGVVTVGEKGQIVLPKKARELFGIKPGDTLMVLGDEALDNPGTGGLALIDSNQFLRTMQAVEELLHDSRKEE